MCGRFVMLTPEEVESVVAAVEGRARARLALGGGAEGEGARPQARPGSMVPYVGKGDGAEGLEIAEAVWVPLDEADERLTYERDRRIMRDAFNHIQAGR